MITMDYLADKKGADRFGTCANCAKSSDADLLMARIYFKPEYSSASRSVCLCQKCRAELLDLLSQEKALAEESSLAGTKQLFQVVIEKLFNRAECRHGFRFIEDMIICETEDQANNTADLLEDMGFDTHTGYYDPEEDRKENNVTDLTGSYYVDWD